MAVLIIASYHQHASVTATLQNKLQTQMTCTAQPAIYTNSPFFVLCTWILVRELRATTVEPYFECATSIDLCGLILIASTSRVQRHR